MTIASRTSAAARRALLAVSEPSTSRSVAYFSRTHRQSGSLRTATLAAPVRYHSSHAKPPPPPPIPAIQPDDSYDIVIIGGANAGLALACSLLTKPSIRQTTRILLLEGGSLDRVRKWDDQAEWENRVSSLTAENVAWLKGIGAWKHIAQHRSCPVEEMVIWANPTPSSSPTIHFPPLGHPMAYMTENTNLQRALLRRIDELNPGTFTLSEGARVSQMQLGPGGRWVGLKVGDKWLRGGVVVGADGPNSPVRHFSNIESHGHGYNTHAVVATLEHDESPFYPNNTAFQRFLPTGPIAFLPLSPTASTMVWSTHPSHAAAYKKLPMDALTQVVNAGYNLPESALAELNAHILANEGITSDQIRSILAAIHIPESKEQSILPPTVRNVVSKSVAGFPLKLSHAESYLGERTVLIGDAAHTTHPLAGQGLNMGLADVQSLTDAWETARVSGGDLGSLTSMAAYPRQQYPANQILLTAVDTLHHVFRARSGPINWLRGTGLDIINEIGPLKKILMGGAGAFSVQKRSEKDREFGRSNPGDQLGSAGGWPHAVAGGLEGWLTAKQVAGQALGLVGGVVAAGVQRAVGAMSEGSGKGDRGRGGGEGLRR